MSGKQAKRIRRFLHKTRDAITPKQARRLWDTLSADDRGRSAKAMARVGPPRWEPGPTDG